jgi:ABC-type Fe3+ transport system permease subunit
MSTKQHVSAIAGPSLLQARLLSWLIAAAWVACGGFLMLVVTGSSRNLMLLLQDLDVPGALWMRWLHPAVGTALLALCMGTASFVLFRSQRFQSRRWTVALAIVPPLLAAGIFALVLFTISKVQHDASGLRDLRAKESPTHHATQP